METPKRQLYMPMRSRSHYGAFTIQGTKFPKFIFFGQRFECAVGRERTKNGMRPNDRFVSRAAPSPSRGPKTHAYELLRPVRLILRPYSPMRASAQRTAIDDDGGQIGIAEFRSLTAVTVRLVGETGRFQVGFQIAAPAPTLSLRWFPILSLLSVLETRSP
jgi:hypothetical protein